MALADGRLFVPVVDLVRPRAARRATTSSTSSTPAAARRAGSSPWTPRRADGSGSGGSRRPVFGCATVARDVVFAATYDGRVYALSRARRAARSGAPGCAPAINACPAVAGDLLAHRRGRRTRRPAARASSSSPSGSRARRGTRSEPRFCGTRWVSALGHDWRSTPPGAAWSIREKNVRAFCQNRSVWPRAERGRTSGKRPSRSGQRASSGRSRRTGRRRPRACPGRRRLGTTSCRASCSVVPLRGQADVHLGAAQPLEADRAAQRGRVRGLADRDLEVHRDRVRPGAVGGGEERRVAARRVRRRRHRPEVAVERARDDHGAAARARRRRRHACRGAGRCRGRPAARRRLSGAADAAGDGDVAVALRRVAFRSLAGRRP